MCESTLPNETIAEEDIILLPYPILRRPKAMLSKIATVALIFRLVTPRDFRALVALILHWS